MSPNIQANEYPNIFRKLLSESASKTDFDLKTWDPCIIKYLIKYVDWNLSKIEGHVTQCTCYIKNRQSKTKLPSILKLALKTDFMLQK